MPESNVELTLRVGERLLAVVHTRRRFSAVQVDIRPLAASNLAWAASTLHGQRSACSPIKTVDFARAVATRDRRGLTRTPSDTTHATLARPTFDVRALARCRGRAKNVTGFVDAGRRPATSRRLAVEDAGRSRSARAVVDAARVAVATRACWTSVQACDRRRPGPRIADTTVYGRIVGRPAVACSDSTFRRAARRHGDRTSARDARECSKDRPYALQHHRTDSSSTSVMLPRERGRWTLPGD